MNREQIINQYISVYEGHAMEKEELEIMLNGFADDIVNNLQPSLPDNLDEAAEEYAWRKEEPLSDGERLSFCFNPRIDAFKAGAEWAIRHLTIEDIEKIHTFLYAIKNNKQGAFTFTRLSDEQYKEVLRRFKAVKEEEK